MAIVCQPMVIVCQPLVIVCQPLVIVCQPLAYGFFRMLTLYKQYANSLSLISCEFSVMVQHVIIVTNFLANFYIVGFCAI